MSTEPEKRSDEETWAKLADAATPGPWWAEEDDGGWDIVPARGPVHVAVTDTGAVLTEADALFIAKARTAVPSLLAALAASRAAHMHERAMAELDLQAARDELAASRADNERLRSENRRLDDALDAVCAEADRHQAERDAARVEVSQLQDHVRELQEQDERNLAEIVALGDEVSQLRAKIEAERDQHQCSDLADMFGGYECGHCGDSYATTVGCINKQRLNALVAEPLGSTEEED